MNMKTNEKYGILYYACDDFPSEGVRFIDLTPSIINTNCRMNLLSKLVNYIENEVKDVDVIICPDARGFIWGTGVATLMNCSLIPIRKHGKLPVSCIDSSINYGTEYSITSIDLPISDLAGKRVFFIDDVYATGGTYNACKTLVDNVGGNLIGGAVIYDVGLDEDNTEIFSLAKGDL